MKKNYYLYFGVAAGVALGVTFDQLALCLCIGVAIGASLDYKKNK